MSTYISSTASRFYVGIEAGYGQAAPIATNNRTVASELTVTHGVVPVKRRDKTGSRTFTGLPGGLRTHTAYQLRSYLTSWPVAGQPFCGSLFQAGLGAGPSIASGLQIAFSPAANQVQTVTAHGLSTGSAVSFSGEIRFVTAVVSATEFELNVPFSSSLPAQANLAQAITYKPSVTLPSLSIYEYRDPSSTISRLITGAVVDEVDILVSGDVHEFTFGGPAADLLDSQTLAAGTAGLNSFPSEPAVSGLDYSIVPGQLGQVWLGNTPREVFSMTAAHVRIRNHTALRSEEYGWSKPLAMVPGARQVEADFSLFPQTDSETEALYAAAKGRTPISALLQLGSQQGAAMALYLPSVTLELPNFDDSRTRLQWHFKDCLTQGIDNDEVYIAFA